jgi:MFS family permease
LLPLLLLVVAEPEQIGQAALGAQKPENAPGTTAASDGTAALKSGAQILSNPAFLVLSLCVGTLTAAGVMMTTHLVPLALDKGLELQSASILLSAFGIAGAAGALLFGWIADRIGGPLAMVLQAFAWILPWTALLLSGAGFLQLLTIAALIGLCSGPIVGLSGVIMNQWLGKENFARAMGYLYLLKVPFLFGAAPFAGYLFDETASYRTSILVHMASFVLVGLLMLLYRPGGADSGLRKKPGESAEGTV